MSHNLKPVTGEWYRHLDKGQAFRVLSVEKDEDTIEIQHFDGDLEEVELTEWFAMDLEPAAAPEDWTGPIDDVESDEVDDTETPSETDWRTSLETKPAREEWQDATLDNEGDERAEGRPAAEPLDDEA